MRAVVVQHAALDLVELPEPVPAAGQVLLEVLRCGICGSDLHARHSADEQADVLVEAGYDGFMRSSQQVVMGHEFGGRIVDFGPRTRRKIPAGATVTAMPLRRAGHDIHAIGLSAAAPGAYAERVVVEESLMLPVPNGLSAELAALTEPMAVGLHAVRRSEVKKNDVAVVVGCGPVGLAVICMLKARGVRTVIASDLSPGRRRLALACGADSTTDPREQSPFADADSHGHLTSVPAKARLGLDTMDKLTRLPFAWQHLWRAADALGAADLKRPVVFECVGLPGMIEQLITSAPLASRIVVAGVCMTADAVRPAMAVNKEIDLRFVVGCTPLEFSDTLRMLAEGKVDARPLLTGTVGLAGVDEAFTALGSPEAHAKILIDPRSQALGITPWPGADNAPARVPAVDAFLAGSSG